MRWEWDDEGDNRVAQLWRLREEISRSNEVVYTKWYQGRATFFSRDMFVAFLAISRGTFNPASLSVASKEILNILRMDSPLSTKQLKLAAGMKGKMYEFEYQRALKQLWSRFLLVGYGEIDDGAFPSLAIGATEILFEDLWNDALKIKPTEAWSRLEDHGGVHPLFIKKLKSELSKQGLMRPGAHPEK
jgi:hypothetical protein